MGCDDVGWRRTGHAMGYDRPMPTLPVGRMGCCMPSAYIVSAVQWDASTLLVRSIPSESSQAKDRVEPISTSLTWGVCMTCYPPLSAPCAVRSRIAQPSPRVSMARLRRCGRCRGLHPRVCLFLRPYHSTCLASGRLGGFPRGGGARACCTRTHARPQLARTQLPRHCALMGVLRRASTRQSQTE